jgi:hypothetical protein
VGTIELAVPKSITKALSEPESAEHEAFAIPTAA